MANEYAWSNTDQERGRLASQADALRGATERLFRAAGIGPGCRVLDCGSGGGDVSLIAAELVTPTGTVLGIDRDTSNVEAARQRVKDLRLSHVRFDTADIRFPPAGPFDAIVGRLVLMYQPDPAAVLDALAARLSPDGVMAFLEYDHAPGSEVAMWPRSPSVDRLFRWTEAGFDVLGVQQRMGTRLPSLLQSAGLAPQPPYELTGAVYCGKAVVDHVNTLMRGLSGVLTANGIATEEEIDIDTFADRVSNECGPDPVLISGPDVSVWARKP